MLKITTTSIIDFKDSDDPIKETHTIKKYLLGWNYKTIITSAEQINLGKDANKLSKSIGFNG